MSLPRIVPMIAVAIALLVAGVFTGKLLRTHHDNSQMAKVDPPAFVAGQAFPDVKLMTEWGDSTTSLSLLAGQDAVVLFLDPECPPCVDMAKLYGGAIEAGKVDPNRVYAVVTQTGPVVGKFNSEVAPRLRVFIDPEKAFMLQHGVTTYPLAVAVSGAGQVTSTSSEPVLLAQ